MKSLYKACPVRTKYLVRKRRSSLSDMYKHSIFNYLFQQKKQIFIIQFG